jgi:hypothetical protein
MGKASLDLSCFDQGTRDLVGRLGDEKEEAGWPVPARFSWLETSNRPISGLTFLHFIYF